MADYRRICCAVDFSESSRAALARAADLARRCGAELTLLHVLEAPPPGSPALFSPPPRGGPPRTHAEDLAAWRKEAERLSGGMAATVLLDGRPAAAIVGFARDEAVDLLVVGSHGEGAMSAAFLGSTALKLLHHSTIPVLVVPRHGKK